ncbi:aldolase [Nonomuraea jiangxiensis]|uniref:Sulfofructosephosphate aldolase n=1 Tax=Nonomuraea jiangxiensis TaxID=633440 RepID=A0A1G9FC97_9ACTN|nr:aldolase [Nonomuraea jiangxiensis]SDK86029.1 sulfofructosephosphate aldolase [Nonomuraea jiangxiensis]
MRRLTAPLESAEGGFAMLALDQRESLRQMFPSVNGQAATDEALREFKSTATRVLSPLTTAVLLDRLYGLTDTAPEGLRSSLIVAADVLVQPPGQPVQTTHLDPAVTPEYIRGTGAAAVKFLVIWEADGDPDERVRLVRSFLDLAAEAGVASLVEAIVRPAAGRTWEQEERHAAILQAARELSTLGGSIYKAEVPGYQPGDLSKVREQSERLSEIVPVPWVVLSNGVEREDFAGALREACLGGASGFLAGRAIWSDTVADPDPLGALTHRSAERLRALNAIVAETSRGRRRL